MVADRCVVQTMRFHMASKEGALILLSTPHSRRSDVLGPVGVAYRPVEVK